MRTLYFTAVVSSSFFFLCPPNTAGHYILLLLYWTREGHYILLLVYLWPPIIMAGHYILQLWFLSSFFLSFFFLCNFPRLISERSETGCLPYFRTWCDLSANLECMPEMCCTRLAEIQDAKIAILAPSHNFVGLYLRSWNMYRQSEKYLLNSDTSSIMSS